MVYFITKLNKMRDEEVKNLKFDFLWITLVYRPSILFDTALLSLLGFISYRYHVNIGVT